MAIPTAPTATTIVTEALKRKLNGGTPESADITRATDYGLEKVKRDIMSINQLWRPLITIAYDITVTGISKYALPTDCENVLNITMMDGTHTSTLSAVASTSSVTLAADEDASESEVEGNYLLITSGTGVNQAVQVDEYNTSTKICTMAEAFSTLCVAGDGYLVCDEFYDLAIEPSVRREAKGTYTAPGDPTHAFLYDDSTYGYVELYPVPDSIQGIKFTYFSDLRRVDLTGTLYATLLRRWAGVLEQGVYVWALSEDDNRYEREMQLYMSMLKELRARDSYMLNQKDVYRRVAE